jgi:transposase
LRFLAAERPSGACLAAPNSLDLRQRVLGAYVSGMRTKEIAEDFEVSPAWARRVTQRRRENNELSPRPMGGKRSEKIDRVRLAELVKQTPDATLTELRDQLGVPCALSAISMALKQLALSFKERRCTRPSKTARMLRSAAPSGSSRGRGSIRVG